MTSITGNPRKVRRIKVEVTLDYVTDPNHKDINLELVRRKFSELLPEQYNIVDVCTKTEPKP